MKAAKIIILAGQSNAVGVGHVKCLSRHFSEEKIKEYFDGYENIRINYFSHDKKSDGFVKVTDGCTEVNKHTVGPEVGMAEYFNQKNPSEEIFIVKCAFGGTNLFCDWSSPSNNEGYDATAYYENRFVTDKDGGFVAVRAGWCYNELVKILGESVDILKGKGYLPVIRAFCWMQGEGDADISEHVENYERRFQNLLCDTRASFGEYFDDLVIVDGGISEIWPLYRELNDVKKNAASESENRFYIDTIGAGLTTKYEPVEEPDVAHYDSDCTIKLGRLFAERIPI